MALAFPRGGCPLSKLPLALDNGCTQPGANIKGETGFGALIAKMRVTSPKSLYSENCVSGSQERLTLGFCLEASKNVKSLCHH